MVSLLHNLVLALDRPSNNDDQTTDLRIFHLWYDETSYILGTIKTIQVTPLASSSPYWGPHGGIKPPSPPLSTEVNSKELYSPLAPTHNKCCNPAWPGLQKMLKWRTTSKMVK